MCGETPEEPTLWLIPGEDDTSTPLPPEMRSNYEWLAGFRTAEQQQAAAKVLLTASMNIVTAEVNRIAREEVVIRAAGRERPPPMIKPN